MSGRTWFKIRMGLMAFGFSGALSMPPEGTAQYVGMLTDWIFAAFAILLLAAVPFMPLAFVSICAATAKADTKWEAPTHCSNPLNIENPLLFLHFGAYFIGASGLGLLLSSLWNGLGAAAQGLFAVLASLMILVGLRLSMRVFKSRIAP